MGNCLKESEFVILDDSGQLANQFNAIGPGCYEICTAK
jgi:hypothetical protein